MKFRATMDQVRQIAVNAIKASKPMGMGYLHYNPNQEFLTEHIHFHVAGVPELDLDYFGGRMVKLFIRSLLREENDKDTWEIPESRPPRDDYQSWCYLYPTYEALVTSVPGVTVLSQKDG